MGWRGLTMVFAGWLLGFPSGQAAGEELRPYNLPSQQQGPLYQAAPEPIIRQEQPVDMQGGEDFRRRVEGLSPEERARLEEGLRERLRQSVRDGRMEEAKYYENLCSILQNVGR